MPQRLRAWLLAIDLDGTLLRHDGTIAAIDRDALRAAAAEGALILLVTARFPRAAQRIARSLPIAAACACLDGALLFDERWQPRAQHTLAAPLLWELRGLCEQRTLALFSVHEQHVWHREQDASHLAYLAGWFEDHPRSCAQDEGHDSLLLLALGEEGAARSLSSAERDPQLASDVFRLGGSELWAARFRHARSNKADAARSWAAACLPARRLAAIGNDYNDVTLFGAAECSFAMADAPPAVASAAGQRLASDGASGGGVAEAVQELLRDS